MTYVPPEKKDKGGSFGDTIYVILFYLIEGLFIFIGIPFLVFAIAIIPTAFYVIIKGEQNITWPLYVVGAIIVFCQILAMQYFIRRYILKPHNKTFGEWLRWKFSPTEIKIRRLEKQERSRKMEKWYDNLDKVQANKEKLIEEQSYNLRSKWQDEPQAEGEGIFVEFPDDDSIMNPEKDDDSEVDMIVLGSDETTEE